tara:strand:- start:3388 stop:4338 length:951 start_codon:yes stop_codon:yes gene_type:complete
MLILEDLSAEVPDTNSFHWNFKKFSSGNDKKVLMYGYNSSNNTKFHDQTNGYKKIYFNNWAPCEFAQSKDHNNKISLDYDNKFNIIYSICPYSSAWLNKLQSEREYRYIFYPFCETLIPATNIKEYDVIYHGGIHCKHHVDCLKTMRNFNYRYCSMTNYINPLTRFHLSYATNTNLSFKDKINLVAASKVSVCYNFVDVKDSHREIIKKLPNYKHNEAFAYINDKQIMPQFKTRFHEAAISRTINLVMRDDWNVIEDFYSPGEDFIYFDDKDDLKNKINMIVNDWDNYQSIVENAYQKSLNYTTKKFIEKIERETK